MKNSMKIQASASILCVGTLVAAAALAADVKVKLSGAEETPPVTTSATAAGTLVVGDDKSVRGTVKSTGLDGNVAHIHTGAKGKAGPPIITLDKGPDGTWVVPAGATLTDDQFKAFKAGELYVNIHSEAHKGGEIRGQMTP